MENFKFCPRCGHAFNYEQHYGQLRPVCSACGRIHFIDPKVAVAVIVEQAGQYVLIQRANEPEQGKWSFPAGFVDAGEHPQAAAAREVREETSLVVTDLELIDVIGKASPTEGADILIVYRAAQHSGTLHAADDAQAAQWFSLSALPPLAFPSTVAMIQRLQNLSR